MANLVVALTVNLLGTEASESGARMGFQAVEVQNLLFYSF